MDDLAKLRATANRLFLALLWVHVPLVAGIAATLGNPWMWPGTSAAGVAIGATIAWRCAPQTSSFRIAISVALMVMVSLLVAVTHGSVMQIDLHMYYFAMLALVTVYCDRYALLAGAGLVALHHLGLNFLASELVFPGGSHLGRVLLHAAILVLETAILVWMSDQLAEWSRSANQRLEDIQGRVETDRVREALERDRRERDDLARTKREAAVTEAERAKAHVVDVLTHGLGRLAAGDLGHRLNADFLPEYHRLEIDFNLAAAQLEGLVRAILASTSSIYSGAEEISHATDDLSRRTEQQATSVPQTAAALDKCKRCSGAILPRSRDV